MSVLVTGGAGYVGSHIALNLLDSGRDVVVVDNLSTGHRCLVPTGAHFEEADVGNEAAMRLIFRHYEVTAVLHCAGSTVVPESVSDPLKYYSNNTAASLALLRAMSTEGVRKLVFSSTAAVYQATETRALNEDSQIDPASPYGMSKWMTEEMIRSMAQAQGLSCFILRYFNVAGADPQCRAGQATPNATHLIKVAVEAALGRRPLLGIFGTDWPTPDGTGVRDFIHVSDLAEVHRRALQYMETGGRNQTLNCGYGHGYSVRHIIETVKKVSGQDIQVIEQPRRPGDLGSVIANPARLQRTLSWAPSYDNIDRIVADALAWEKHWQSGGAVSA